MELIFAKFDSKRNLWAAAAQTTAMLDAVGSLAQASSGPSFCRPEILECPPGCSPCVNITQGRHPCVEITHNGGEFIPNDLSLGEGSGGDNRSERVLLLSGPNMVSSHGDKVLSRFELTAIATLGWKKYSSKTDMPHCHSRANGVLCPSGQL